MTEAALAAAGRRVPSLVFRLGLAVSLVLLAGGAAVTVAALAYGRQAAQEAYDRLLVGAANQIAGSVTIQEGRVIVDIPVSAFELLAMAGDDRVAYRVVDQDGATITGYDGVALPPDDAGDSALYNGSFGGEPVRLSAVRRRFAERAYSGAIDVIVGHTLQARRALARDIAENALVVVGVAGLFMVSLAVFAIRSALEPLRRIERRLSERDPSDLTPLDVAVPREIGTFVVAINRFMRRLDGQMAALQGFIADASHQLRTPVAALRAQSELAKDETDPDRLRAIVGRIHDRSVGLSRLTGQLLSHALIIHRTDAAPRERIDLRTVAIRAVAESDRDPESAETRVRLDLPEDPVWVQGDALSLAEACKNLLNNAIRYGTPPLAVAVAAEGPTAAIRVRDQGPGIPEAHWADAGTRFSRKSGVSADSAGLGLAIVGAVAAAHAGRLRFSRPQGGGFEALLDLPRDGQAPP